MATVIHPFLKDGVEARAYQMRSLKSALASSTLMVMPTGFGKTAVEWMAMAEALRLERGKILLIAPTTGLVDQQRRMAIEMLNIEAGKIVSYTGDFCQSSKFMNRRQSNKPVGTSLTTSSVFLGTLQEGQCRCDPLGA